MTNKMIKGQMVKQQLFKPIKLLTLNFNDYSYEQKLIPYSMCKIIFKF